jgi:hypothetical protein
MRADGRGEADGVRVVAAPFIAVPFIAGRFIAGRRR